MKRVEVDKNAPCPCGSGNLYEKCCKKKSIEYYIEGDKIGRTIPISDEASMLIEEIREEFQDFYGRSPKDDEKVFFAAHSYNNQDLLRIMSVARSVGIGEEKVYAMYKTDGVMPTEMNADVLPQGYLDEFEYFQKEYTELMEADFDENTMNVVQYIQGANGIVGEVVDQTIYKLIHCLNDFINRHIGEEDILQYVMKDELDYCLFSALKTIKTLESIDRLMEANLSECIYSISRSIFENYLYLYNINANGNFFETRLLPKVDEENYHFDTHKNGKVNYNKVVHRETGSKLHVKINIYDLTEALTRETDKQLYNIFYQNSCQYVHVDLLSAKSYFSVYEPYDEVNPSLIAGFIASILSLLLLVELSKNGQVQGQFQKDIEYFSKSIKKSCIDCLFVLDADDNHSNAIYKVLLDRLDKEFP